MFTQALCVIGMLIQYPLSADCLDGSQGECVNGVGATGGSGGDVLLDDVYFVSYTRILKLQRYSRDTLKSCRYWNKNASNSELLLSSTVAVSERVMWGLVQQCERAVPGGSREGEKVIYPGTKWCGTGNEASDYDDLGTSVALDTCCRAHDTCRPTIGAFETKFGLYNFAIWTKQHCRCDKRFYRCLKAANTSDADSVGNLFFNVLAVGCFKKVHPMKCLSYNWLGFCNKYIPDRSKPKQWAFVDTEYTY